MIGSSTQDHLETRRNDKGVDELDVDSSYSMYDDSVTIHRNKPRHEVQKYSREEVRQELADLQFYISPLVNKLDIGEVFERCNKIIAEVEWLQRDLQREEIAHYENQDWDQSALQEITNSLIMVSQCTWSALPYEFLFNDSGHLAVAFSLSYEAVENCHLIQSLLSEARLDAAAVTLHLTIELKRTSLSRILMGLKQIGKEMKIQEARGN